MRARSDRKYGEAGIRRDRGRVLHGETTRAHTQPERLAVTSNTANSGRFGSFERGVVTRSRRWREGAKCARSRSDGLQDVAEVAVLAQRALELSRRGLGKRARRDQHDLGRR